MSNGLSQAEIDALIRGDSPPAAEAAVPAAPSVAELPAETVAAAPETQSPTDMADTLSPDEMDAMGEIGNISMGTAATTLFTMLNRRVAITTPRVKVASISEISQQYPLPFVAVEVQYTTGLEGTNILFLREIDVKIITDLLMGGDGTNTQDDLNEMHLSAISEVMNQMVGSSSTSMAKLIGRPIDISPPHAYQINLANQTIPPFATNSELIACTSFDMEIEGLINSEIMQVMPLSFARTLVKTLLGGGATEAAHQAMPSTEEMVSAAAQTAPPPAAPAPSPVPPRPAQTQAPAPAAPSRPVPPQQMVDVRPIQFDSFDQPAPVMPFNENIDLLMDVPLPVSVELGKSKKYIKEILDFNVGSIIVLDKMAGELVDIMVNGKLIARGEVVVIDDSYGARITDIVSPSRRIDPGK